ncbi:MAG: helix-turn-helix transcriptional regulator [Calditrichaeota bacterium]|nr:helix-turn-helix transcriptional regulator [Calditrichota bacterium]
MNIDKALGLAIKQNLEERKLSRLKLAEISGVSYSTLFLIDKGKQSPSLQIIYEISIKGFGMNPGKLVSQAYSIMTSTK